MKQRALIGILGLAIAVDAQGASILVRPTTVILAGSESAATVTITNSGQEPVSAQLRIFNWTQDQNQDQLEQSSAVVASPPMVTLPAGQSQTVRLVRVATERPKAEESYRLLVDEITDRKSAQAASGVAIALRYSVPVFVMPKPAEPARATVKATLSANMLVLAVSNRGQSHAQVSNVTLNYPDGSAQVVNAGLIGYVLPNEQREWKLELPASRPSTAPQRVRAVINGKELLVAL